jgi:hypothetical protein
VETTKSRLWNDAKKLTDHKNNVMKNQKITEMEIEEIKIEMKEDQRSHINNSVAE